jgi:hypothetical protein
MGSVGDKVVVESDNLDTPPVVSPKVSVPALNMPVLVSVINEYMGIAAVPTFP